MKKLIELKNGEDILAVDYDNQKVLFNGNEVVKMSFNADDAMFFLEYDAFEAVKEIADWCRGNEWYELSEEEKERLEDDYEMIKEYLWCLGWNALVYKNPKTNKEHLIEDSNGKWLRKGKGWDSIEDGDREDSAFAYGISGKKRVRIW